MVDAIGRIRWKIDRGRELFDVAEVLLSEWRASQPVEMKAVLSSDDVLSMVVSRLRDIPPYYLLIVDEIVHHLRSALDHMTDIIARPRNDQEAREVCFPICESYADFAKRSKRSLPGCDAEMTGVFERLQPYRSNGDPSAPDPSSLVGLRDLSNWTKHRSLTTAIAELSAISVRTGPTGQSGHINVTTQLGPLLVGKTIVNLRPSGEFSNGDEVSASPFMRVGPVFSSSMPHTVRGQSVSVLVTEAGRYVDECVFPALVPIMRSRLGRSVEELL